MLESVVAASNLLIVAPREWVGALEAYAASKRALPTIGSCECVSVEELQDGHAGDEAERLKRGLHARWSRAGAVRFDSVLLVGDMHVVPTRYMMLDRATKAACDVAFYPSDLYFADLVDDAGAFEDWNARTDGVHAGYIGEVHGEAGKTGPIDADGCGLVPEIAVGRWPAATREEAVAIGTKSARHEQAQRDAWLACPGSRPRAVVVACGEWIDNRARIERIAEAMRGGFDVACLSYFATDESTRPTPARVSDAFATGPSLMLHTGHGDAMLWHHGLHASELGRSAGTSGAGPEKKDGRVEGGCLHGLPVLVSIGCSTAVVAPQPPYEAYRDVNGKDHAGTNAGEAFDAPPPPPACVQPRSFAHESIGTASVRRAEGGAVAYIGCVTGSQPCAHTLLDGLALRLSEQPDTTIGEAWRASLTRYVAEERLRELQPTADWYPPSIYFQPMKFVLLGDPTLRLR